MAALNQAYDISNLTSHIDDFYETIKVDIHSYNLSWEYCYRLFNEMHDGLSEKNRDLSDSYIDFLCLNLAFYLASWGMYRGRAFLSKKDYKIHELAVKTIFYPKYNSLWSINLDDTTAEEETIMLILEASEDIKTSYSPEVPTKTLLTKIMMGTFGCTLAYDRISTSELKKRGLTGTFSKKSLTEIFNLYRSNKIQLDAKKYRVGENDNPEMEYPPMKLIDMCFWHDS